MYILTTVELLESNLIFNNCRNWDVTVTGLSHTPGFHAVYLSCKLAM